jgi:Polysaccharide lyase 14
VAYPLDGLYFSTFFGGSGSDWAPPKDETIDFDGFVISTSAIGQ